MISTKSPKDIWNYIVGLPNKKLFSLALVFVIIDTGIALTNIYINRVEAYHLNGEVASPDDPSTIISLLKGIFISFPILCAILTFITTIFVGKGQPYGKRYLRGYLYTLIIVFGSFIIINIIGLILRLQ